MLDNTYIKNNNSTGKLKSSTAFSEFIYSAVNTIVLINDQILLSEWMKRTQKPFSANVFSAEWSRLRIFFTMVENLSVFLELYATKVWGKFLFSNPPFYYWCNQTKFKKKWWNFRNPREMDSHNSSTSFKVGSTKLLCILFIIDLNSLLYWFADFCGAL